MAYGESNGHVMTNGSMTSCDPERSRLWPRHTYLRRNISKMAGVRRSVPKGN